MERTLKINSDEREEADSCAQSTKKSYTSGTLSETRHFYYFNGWQVLEERSGTGFQPMIQYVWGLNYVDELVCRDRDANGGTTGDGTLEQTHYAAQDANFNVTALINTSGTVAERYRYTPYGQRTVLDDNFALDSDGLSDVDFVPGHQGLMHDSESGLIENRNRLLHATLGRFVQRDPAEYTDGISVYCYVTSNPIILLDPWGEVSVSFGFKAFIPKDICFDISNNPLPSKRWFKAPVGGAKDGQPIVATDDRSKPGEQGSSRLFTFTMRPIDADDIGNLKSRGGSLTNTISGDSYKALMRENSSRGVVLYRSYVKNSLEGPKKARPNHSETVEDINACQSKVTIAASGTYPFGLPGPAINYTLALTLTTNPDRRYITVEIKGSHNEFPAYEALVNGDVIYSDMPNSSGPGLLNLGVYYDNFEAGVTIIK